MHVDPQPFLHTLPRVVCAHVLLCLCRPCRLTLRARSFVRLNTRCDVQPLASLTLTGVNGTVEVSRGGWGQASSGYRVSSKVQDGGGDFTNKSEDFAFDGVEQEFRAFRDLVNGSEAQPVDAPGHPEQAYADLALISTLISAGNSGATASVPSLQ